MVLKIIIFILFLVLALLMYGVIVGANKTKTDEERKLEDEEQMRILNEYRRKK